MRVKLRTALFALVALSALARGAAAQQFVTLQQPLDRVTKKLDQSRSWLSFAPGAAPDEGEGRRGDLGYGFLAMGAPGGPPEDWFQLAHGDAERSVIRDLGALDWADEIKLPALAPLPELKPGESRVVRVDASADTHKEWARTNSIFAKVIVGHVYAVRVVRGQTDYYALFRVEAHEQGVSCTISWRPAEPPPEPNR